MHKKFLDTREKLLEGLMEHHLLEVSKHPLVSKSEQLFDIGLGAALSASDFIYTAGSARRKKEKFTI